MSNVIDIDRVSKWFGKQHVLDDVSLEIPAGCVFALLGENGAGKTTLVRILLGLCGADQGSTRILGTSPPFARRELAMRVGYVPDRPVFHDWMTVAETGWYTAGFLGDEFHARFLQQIERFELPLTTRTRELSKGMRAKLALSLAMAKDPDVFILDEPTSGLDAIVRREVLESLVDLAAQGKTILLCSHQIQEVERVADYVAILDGSRVKVVERLERLKTSYYDCRVTMTEVNLERPKVGGSILRHRRSGRQWQLFVEAENLQQLELAALEAHPQVEKVEALTPSLEEIFVGVLGHTLNLADNPADVSASVDSQQNSLSQ